MGLWKTESVERDKRASEIKESERERERVRELKDGKRGGKFSPHLSL